MNERTRRRYRFFGPLWLATMLLAFVPTLVLARAHQRQTTELIEHDVHADLESSSASVARYTELWIDNIVAALEQLAREPTLTGGPLAVPSDSDPFDPPRGDPADPRRATLKAALRFRPFLRSAFVARASDGMQTAHTETEHLRFVGDRDYFREALAGHPGISVIHSRVTALPTLAVAVPIRDKTNAIVAVVAATAELAAVTSEIANATRGMPWHAIVVDSHGAVAANPDRAAFPSDAKSHPAVASHLRGATGLLRYTHDGVDCVGIVRDTKHGFTVVLERDARAAFEPLERARVAVLKLAAVVAAFVTLLSLLMSRWFAERIESLLAKSDAFWATTLHLERKLGPVLTRPRALTWLALYGIALFAVFVFYRDDDIGVPLGAFAAHAVYTSVRRFRARAATSPPSPGPESR